jgi:hypothetical protein
MRTRGMARNEAALAAWARAAPILALVAIATGGAAFAAAGDLRFGVVGFQGDFAGDDQVRLEQVPIDLVLTRPGHRLTLTLPYDRIDHTGKITLTSDGPVVLGAGGPGRPPYQTSAAGGAEAGLGDITLRDDIFLLRAGKGKRPAITWVLDIKWPTADEKRGLGTGRRDWGAGLSYMQPLGKRWQILAEGLYRFMGDPRGIDFNDRLRLAGGVAIVTSQGTWRAMLENMPPVLDRVPVFDASGSPIGMQEVQDRRLVRLDVTARSQSGGTTRLGVTTGLTNGAEDVGVMLEFSTGGR